MGLAGSPVMVEHVDGGKISATLPDNIEPWQPF
jgi:D-apionolactonase